MNANKRRYLSLVRWLCIACLLSLMAACVEDQENDSTSETDSDDSSAQATDNTVDAEDADYLKGLGEEVTVLTAYSIQAGALSEPRHKGVSRALEAWQMDSAKHTALWALSKGIVESHLSDIGRFVIFTDGKDETLATVFRLESAPEVWVLAVDIQDAFNDDSTLDFGDFVHTLVHEYGHVLSLNGEQFELDEEVFYDSEDQDLFDAKKAECPALFLQEGCAYENAYLNAFYEQFWTELEDEFVGIDNLSDSARRSEAKEDFFKKYETRFVSEYAATNVTEDFAESWTQFVLKDKPEPVHVRDEKVLFFYSQPELVTLREDILTYLAE